jgi:3'(2'), 5'-bisphosphate nucleotidase
MMNEKIAIEACIVAGNDILKIYCKDFDIDYKQDNSPLTEADRIANSIIINFLEKTNIPIISEENKQLPYEERQKWTSCWIIDPLDGTKEFIKKNDEFTVNIALVENGRPILGVIYAPALKELYYGNVKEGKAYKIKVDSNDIEYLIESRELISPKKDTNLIRIVGSRSHMNTETQDFIDTIKKGTNKSIEMIAKGSSLKLCLIAEGVADIYPRFAPTMEWDIAAGHAICNAVGIKVLKQNSTEELEYNKENLLNPNFLVAND